MCTAMLSLNVNIDQWISAGINHNIESVLSTAYHSLQMKCIMSCSVQAEGRYAGNTTESGIDKPRLKLYQTRMNVAQ